MSKKLLTLLGLCTVFVGLELKAQDPHFTQSYANPLYLNPAFAGINRCPTLSINYRNQYPTYGVYQTYSASYDQYVEGMNGGIGLLALRDEAGNGTLTNTEFSGIYSYHLEVTRKFTVLAGLQATLRQRGLNWGDFRFPDEIDPFFGFVRESSEVAPGQNTNTHFDMSTGLIGFTEHFYIGVAAHHLTQPDEAFFVTSSLPLKFTTHAGFTIPLGRKRLNNSIQNYIVPNIVYQTQGSNNQLTINTSFSRGPLSGGLGFRTSNVNPDAFVILLGYAPAEGEWKIGYSYDLTISEQQNSFGGAHEISLGYKFPCRVRKRVNRAIKCPKF